MLGTAQLLPQNTVTNMADALATQGFFVSHQAVSETLCYQLYQAIKQSDTEFRAAEIGQGNDQQRHDLIRNDKIQWINNDDSVFGEYYRLLDSWREQLAQQLLMSLPTLEAHVAHYQQGAFYQKHLDNFQQDRSRQITLVLYLNPQWQAQFGGELALYHNMDDTQPFLTITPSIGTLAVFISERFPHEVLPATQDRYSIACWFRYPRVL